MTQTPNADGTLQEAMGTDPADATHMLSERVYRSILRLVRRGQLRGGAPLRIEELSRILNVSPTPVREGLARLAATGLVIHEPRKGFRVAQPLTGAQFELLMDARELLEVGAAGLALATDDPEFVPSLRQALSDQEAAVRTFTDPVLAAAEEDAEWAVIDADLAFHHVLFEHTHNTFMIVMADSLNGQSHRLRQQADRGVSDAVEAVSEHASIVRAAESGDRTAIESAMRMHLRLVRARARQDIAARREDPT
jgi:DNA-binding GntR family transcriptional regulator